MPSPPTICARCSPPATKPHIEIGTVYPTDDIRGALYVDPMLAKHFAVLGSTGTGKSTSVSLILHRISELSPEGHIVMIDPHGEYSAAFKGCGELFNVDNLQLPYWLMNFEEHCEVLLTTQGAERQRDADILAKCLLAARTKGKDMSTVGKVTVDSPIPYLLTDLNTIIVNEMGKLERAGDTLPFQRLKTKLDELRADPRYTFMFSGMLVSDSMPGLLAKLFRLPSHGSRSRSSTCRAFRPKITSVVVSVLARMVFDYAIWSRTEAQRPLLLVCEEAHRYVPKDEHADGQAVRKILERIAKEGRKYGVSLGLITQRPSDLGRRRAVAVRHDHRDAPEQRPRSGLRPGRDARRRARLPRRHPGACATANASSAAKASRSRSGCGSTTSSPRSARPRPIRASPACGARPATKTASSSRTIKRWRGHGR